MRDMARKRDARTGGSKPGEERPRGRRAPIRDEVVAAVHTPVNRVSFIAPFVGDAVGRLDRGRGVGASVFCPRVRDVLDSGAGVDYILIVIEL